ncbi:YCF48-related protein [Pelomonas sp. KK5]|uniref:WD40/YVTN/BNR-like repeat-containing protein n=1 Tax=Pelomonas sp. KK5 TaxID=1855730 RepID=UPI00097C3A1D|nr:YCF48-related protein [Pelomonas sp. KK5]
MKRATRAAALIGAALLVGAYPVAAQRNDPLQHAALQVPRAAQGVMLAVAAAGPRWVAAGERGIVLWSDDGAANWQQAKVPVSVSLTSLSFPSPQQGWAAGHSGTVLHTADGGKTWTLQLDGRAAAVLERKAAQASGDAGRVEQAEQLVSDGPDKPFLAVHFWNAQRGFVIGAYGLIFGTEDGGKTWTSWSDRLDNPRGLHLNALHVEGDLVMLAGEQGLLLRSTNGGRRFEPVETPYKGSWFAIAGRGEQVVVGGLRGNVFWSGDRGRSFSASQVPVPVTISSALLTRDGDWLFSNQAGLLLRSKDQGRSLQPLNTLKAPPGPPLTALAQGADGALVAASFAGALRLAPQ